jgi:predicted TPR repeat methyltransferase
MNCSMKKVFNEYAKVYDLLYESKDYKLESDYIHELIQKYSKNAHSILDLGCGTGRHDIELAKKGYEITGVDLSSEMLIRAHANSQKQDVKCNFVHGDVRYVRLDQKYDVVLALFHVASYQTTNEDLLSFFQTASYHLKKNGLLIFDFWYGPAVVTEKPSVRIKEFENNDFRVIRISHPKMYLAENIVAVQFEVFIYNKSVLTMDTLNETHLMRYLFLPELKLLLEINSLESLTVLDWLKTDENQDINSWYALMVAKH